MVSTSGNQTVFEGCAQNNARHQLKGGTYLVVADGSDESLTALKYAGQMARANGCHVGLLSIIEGQDFQHWGNIQARMKQEQHEESERVLSEACLAMEADGHGVCSIYIEDGGRMETLSRVIEGDPNITMLVLCGGTANAGPGPLVSHFTGKGLSKLGVPLLIVPDHLTL